MKIMYKSDDGLLFENEAACQEYELTRDIRKHIFYYGDIVFCNEKNQFIYDIDEILNGTNVFSIAIKDERGLALLKRIDQWNGMYGSINSIGSWRYNGTK